jgi:NDP-sugar pyrophosphorylase family protein
MLGLKAGIIAAGEGSRLMSEGVATPKPLIHVNGVPLIERLIRIFIRHGVTEVVCIVNEYSIKVKEYVESKHFDIPIKFVVKTTPSSMHSLFELSSFLQTGQFLLSTVDPIFYENEFVRYIEYARRNQSKDGIIAITDYIDDENPLYVKLNDSNKITEFVKSEKTKWVTGGLYIFSPKIFKEKEIVLKQGMERLRHFLDHLVKQGYQLESFPFSKVIDVDHKKDITAAEEMLSSERHG